MIQNHLMKFLQKSRIHGTMTQNPENKENITPNLDFEIPYNEIKNASTIDRAKADPTFLSQFAISISENKI